MYKDHVSCSRRHALWQRLGIVGALAMSACAPMKPATPSIPDVAIADGLPLNRTEFRAVCDEAARRRDRYFVQYDTIYVRPGADMPAPEFAVPLRVVRGEDGTASGFPFIVVPAFDLAGAPIEDHVTTVSGTETDGRRTMTAVTSANYMQGSDIAVSRVLRCVIV